MESLAKLLVILVAIALLLQLMKFGPAGPRAWLKAKFLGEPPETVVEHEIRKQGRQEPHPRIRAAH